MKKLLSATLILFAVVSFSACDLFDNADDVAFTRDLEESFDVTIAGEGQDVEYSENLVLDATMDDDIDKYKDRITEIDVNKIEYQITSFNGPEGATASGSFGFSHSSSDVPELTITLP